MQLVLKCRESTGIVAHVGASAAVHDPVVVVVEGRGGRSDITDKGGRKRCLIGHRSQAGRWFAEKRGARLGAWVAARWVPNNAPATVMGVTRFATLSATEVATGGAGVGCCEGHGFRRQWTDAKKELEDAFIVYLFLQIFERGKLTFEVIETGIIPVAETRLKVNPNSRGLVWYSRELARDGLMEFKIQRAINKTEFVLGVECSSHGLLPFGKLSPVRRPETRTRLGESEGWRVYGEETVEVGGEDVELEEDEEAMEVWGRDRV
uniref:Uncharacterized protein n=1 Tax=Fagus sylvatica TaxID=28930 RepID=A0A2N9IJE1_FAGSY